jgi:hypothetical protein
MHWSRRWMVMVAALAVPVLASVPSASAETFLGLRNVDCNGVTVSAAGLPADASLVVTLTDPQQRPLDRQSLTTSAGGAFIWSKRISLSGLRSVRAVVTRPGASVPIAWTEHSVPTPCPLVNTGTDHAVPLAGLALGSIVLGFLLLTAVSYRGYGRHLGFYRGRHVAVR